MVVRSIFKMCLEGKGNETITHLLQENKVLLPNAYWQSKGMRRGGKKTYDNPYKWVPSTVNRILAQQEYCGDVVNFRTYSKSYKNKKRLDNDPENWVIFKDVHEPIIDRETFEHVQKKTATTKRRAPKPENGEKSIFCDLLYCADCHSKLWSHVNTRNKDIHFFSCSNYKKDYRGTCESRHYIRADAIEQIVMLELQKLAGFLIDDEEAFNLNPLSTLVMAESKGFDSRRELRSLVARGHNSPPDCCSVPLVLRIPITSLLNMNKKVTA